MCFVAIERFDPEILIPVSSILEPSICIYPVIYDKNHMNPKPSLNLNQPLPLRRVILRIAIN